MHPARQGGSARTLYADGVMDPQRWPEIRALFAEFVELDPGARTQRLESLAEVDPALGAALAALLAADAEADERLARLDGGQRDSAADGVSAGERGGDVLGLSGRTIAHFHVLEAHGAGGMGVVYRAEDTRLGRPVALKFLLPQYSFDASAKDRFLREARSVAALDHPNICTVYEAAESEDGWLFLAMPLYAGETLRARLDREGPLPAAAAGDVACQLARGLGCAHAAGIIHRDIKPGNVIVLPDGTVKILDFGLAKARDFALTVSGATLGTVAYMAPEQIEGGVVDARTDLWALGVVLYEMVTGRRPFTGESQVAIAHAVLHEEPAAPSALRPDAPPALEATILDLLRKDAAARPASADALLRRLERPSQARPSRLGHAEDGSRRLIRARWFRRRRRTALAALTLGAAALLSGVALIARGARANGSAPPPGGPVAVLPFEDLGRDRGDASLAPGLQQELMAQLSRLGRIGVVSTTSTARFANSRLPLREIGSELGARTVIDGTVQRSGNRVRVTARALDVRLDRQLWGESYDGDLADVLDIETDIARSIAGAVQSDLTPAQRSRLAAPPTRNARAYEVYLQGSSWQVGQSSRWQENWENAERLYGRAVELDPEFALARARMALMSAFLYGLGYDRSAARLEEARTEAETALHLQADLSDAHLALGYVYLFGNRDFVRALGEFRSAHASSPGDGAAALAVGFALRSLGRWDEAIATFRATAEKDPLCGTAWEHLAVTYTGARRYVEAVQAWDRAIDLAPNPRLLLRKAIVFLQWEGSTDSLEAALARTPPDWDVNGEATSARVLLARIQRKPSEVLAALDRSRLQVLLRPPATTYAPVALLRAQAHQAVGETGAARAELATARELVETQLSAFPDDPRFHVALGEVYAAMGRREDAVREAHRVEELRPVERDADEGPAYLASAARIFAHVGDKDEALAALAVLMRIPNGEMAPGLSVPVLRLDPVWDPLRSDPRFQRLLRQSQPGAR